MTNRAGPKLACVTALVLLSGMLVQSVVARHAADAEDYHAAARTAIASIPVRFGAWVGTPMAVPRSAEALLRPNALLSRRYRNVETGRVAELVVVQCRDARDMAGHYPPNCYPAHGWEPVRPPTARVIDVAAGGQEPVAVPVMEYAFARREFDRASRIVIASVFVLPSGDWAVEMSALRALAGDVRLRGLGAAQVQVITDADMSVVERDRLVGEVLGAAWPALEVVRGADGSDGP